MLKFIEIFKKNNYLKLRNIKNKVVIGQSADQALADDQEHWVEHICDEYVNADQKSVGGYANLHGFKEGNGTYWVGVDIRWCGIRITDVVIKCKTKALYDYYINLVMHGDTFHSGVNLIAQAVREDSRLWCRDGDEVDTEFTFRWGDEDKSFDVHLGGDRYAEEK